MQRHLILLILMTIILTLIVGCDRTEPNNEIDWEPTQYGDVNELDNVTMEAKEEGLTPTRITVVLENNSDIDLQYGEFFILEKKFNQKWYEVPVTLEGDYGFNDIAYALPVGERVEVEIDLEWLYGSIESGQYRIIKDVLEFKDTGDYYKHYLAAEFTIEE